MALSDYITASILSEKLGIAPGSAKAILDSVGGGEKLGRTTFYSREAVRNALVDRNEKLLTFLGYEAGTQASKENTDA